MTVHIGRGVDDMLLIKTPGKPTGLLSGGRFVTITNASTEKALIKAGIHVVVISDITDRARIAKGFSTSNRRSDVWDS